MAQEFWLFILNVAYHYPSLLTGGVIAVGIMFYERIRKKNISWRTFLNILGFALFLSFFLAWRDEHHNAEVLKQEKSNLTVLNASLQGQIGTKQQEIDRLRDERINRPTAERNLGLRSIREQLGAFLSEGDQLAKTVCGITSSTPTQTETCREAKTNWERKVEQYLEGHLDSSFSVRFKHETKHWAGPQLEMGYATNILSQFISEIK
jgi:hypothetical protein